MESTHTIPEWTGSVFERWAKKYVAANSWRVYHIFGDYEDCIQECYMQYLYCRQHYPNVTPNHFNFMYMTAVHNVFATASLRDFRLRESYHKMLKASDSIESDAQMVAKLTRASVELTSVLKILLEAPQEIMEVLRKEVGKSSHPKQTFKCAVRMAGLKIERAAGLMKELQRLLA